MNLRSIVNGATSLVNPNTEATYQASSGYTTEATGRRVPSFAAAVTVMIQEQAMTGKDLQQVAGLNLQGELRAFYVTGRFRGVSRPDVKGGDLITNARGKWLVAQVLEDWPDWCKVAAVRQMA